MHRTPININGTGHDDITYFIKESAFKIQREKRSAELVVR